MATKKAVKPATTTKSNPGTAMIPWEEQMAKDAAIAAAMTGAATGTFISFRGGVISVDKTPVPGNKLEAVVVAHVFENAYYPGIYDADNPQPPVCFAFGTVDSELKDTDMKPHEMSTEPQHSSCFGCPQNQWASADQGRGKACKNVRRLALIAGDEESIVDADSIAAQKVHYAKTPVTSSKNWDGYVKQVASTLRRPPMGVVTTISAAPDAKSQFKVEFELARKIETGEQYEALAKVGKYQQTDGILFPYQPAQEQAPAPPARGGKVNKFAGRPAAKFAGKPAGRR